MIPLLFLLMANISPVTGRVYGIPYLASDGVNHTTEERGGHPLDSMFFTTLIYVRPAGVVESTIEIIEN